MFEDIGLDWIRVFEDICLGHDCLFHFSKAVLRERPVIGLAGVKGKPASATWVLVPSICRRKRANVDNERDREM
jgi:hypothetical protein